MPPATMDAVRDHGKIASTIEDDLDGAKKVLADMAQYGLSLEEVTDALVVDGVQQFADAADKLYGAVAHRRAEVLGGKIAPIMSIKLGDKALEEAVAAETEQWRHEGLIRDLWAGDKGVWTGADEDKWLGWLSIVDHETKDLANARGVRPRRARRRDFRTTSCCSAWADRASARRCCPKPSATATAGRPFHMLDSTDPAQVATIEHAIDLKKTLFIVSSEVRQHARAEHLQAVFLREVAGSDRCGGQAFRRRHRPRLAHGRGREEGRVPPHLLRREVDRRPLLRAVEIRHGAGGCHGPST